MNKKQLLDDLKAKTFCDKFLGAEEIPLAQDDLKTTNNIKMYAVHFMDVNADKTVGVCRKITAYVYDEGLPTEKAVYKDVLPETQIKTVEVAPA